MKKDRSSYYKKYYWRNREKFVKYSRSKNVKKRNKKRYQKLKMKVLSFYSNGELKCKCCSDNRYCFLTIDHIVPVIKKLGARENTGFLYHRLLKHNFPNGFQVLCMNCNKLKNTKVKCPCKKIIKKEKRPIWN